MVRVCQSSANTRCLQNRRFSNRFVLAVIPLLVFSPIVYCQLETATISGVITDQSGGIVVGAEVRVTNTDTNVTFATTSNQSGIYLVTGLKPGRYRVNVAKEGFKGIDLTDLILSVQDSISRNFTLQVGSTSQTVSVDGSALQINTQDASVSTIVDRRFVENMPLNGRSFQTLITLTPGVVLTGTGSGSDQGQFSVNGQRSDANYFTVDGVSANIGVFGGNGLAQSAGGAIPGFSAQGGTNSLVSVDAMQEFRIETSSFAPEYGSTPGGQVAIVTRSGTNQFHGTLFDYFRNDVLDASDWFNGFGHNPPLRKAKDRQNDFGGVVGGPIIRDKTFFFFSYEGLRLRQPVTQDTSVPDTAARQAAPAGIQPFLNAYPIQNGPELGAGFARFSGSYSNPSSLDAYGFRLDHAINSRLNVFGRYSHSPSETGTRRVTAGIGDLSTTTSLDVSVHTLTVGLTQNLPRNISNELRLNYSNVRAANRTTADDFGGAVPPPDSLVFPSGISSADGLLLFNLIGAGTFSVGKNQTNEQRQANVVDNVSVTAAKHQLKFGADYRWLAPFASPVPYNLQANFLGINGPTGALSGKPLSATVNAMRGDALLSRNFSLYGQDTWRIAPRLTLTYGLRWDVNPALTGKNSDSDPFTVTGLANPATMTLAPRGTRLYQTTYGNVAPRVGLAFQIRKQQSWQTVLRGGGGVFYDLGAGFLGQLTSGFPYLVFKPVPGASFPLSPQQAAAPVFNLNPPVTTPFFAADPGLKLPRSYEWNVALEQSLGSSQTLSLTYVGAVGRDLLRQDTFFSPSPTFRFLVTVTRNTATSDYHGLQLRFQRHLSRGLQTLASYTWSHSVDIASSDSGAFNTPASIGAILDRGNSDFDVRHSFAGALSYDVPTVGARRLMRGALGGWSLDTFITARSAPPVNILASITPLGGILFQTRPNVVPGAPFYLFGSQYPGGKALNKAAFTNPAVGQQGNLGRNAVRGFGAWQLDFALRRQIHLAERLGLQFRAEFFNIFNHPNFGPPTNSLTSPLFGQTTQSLASSLGAGGISGGLNPLYQIGGPRSIQLALKLQF